jgi:hypothetical protein
VDSFASIDTAAAQRFTVVGDGGVRLALYRLNPARDDAPVLLWGHAGGFAAGSYLPLLVELAQHADVFAFDARGSDAPAQGSAAFPGTHADLPHYAPARFARDLAAIARAVSALRPGASIHYGAHSLNAAALLRLGGEFAEIFTSLPWGRFILFEPPLFPAGDAPEHEEASDKNRFLVVRTIMRRAAWPAREDLVAYLTGRGVFAALSRPWLDAHVRATLRPVASGGFELACSPQIEATIYGAFGDDSTWRTLPDFPYRERVHLVGGDPESGAKRDWVTAVVGSAARVLRPGRFTILPGLGHFMIFEDARIAHRLITETLQ